MWVQAVATRSRMTHSKKAKNKVNPSRVKETRVEMMEMKTKKKIQSKPSLILLDKIRESRQRQRKRPNLSPERKRRRQKAQILLKSPP